MHVQRIHYSKLLVTALILTGVILFVVHKGEIQANTIDIVDIKRDDDMLNDISRTSEESLAIARVDSCPVCFGKDLCTEINEGFLTVSMFGENRPYGTVYQGRLNDKEPLSVLSPHVEWWESWDREVCRNSSRAEGCPVASVARDTFLYRWGGDQLSLRALSGLSGLISPSPLTACVTTSLALALRKAFDENHDGGLELEEKSALLSSLAVSPATAMLRLGGELGLISHLPRYIGCCGRLAVYEGGLTRLEDEVLTSWDTRAELALQILTLLDKFLALEGWVMVAWDLQWEDFSLSRSGQVVFTGLDKLTPVDKAILPPPDEEERPVCNSDCFSQYRRDVMMSTPRGQPGRGCSSALLYADMMVAQVCLNIFSSEQTGRLGLLHSAPEEVAKLVTECREEQSRGGRWSAVDDLRAALGDREEASIIESDTTTEDIFETTVNSTEEDSSESDLSL